MVEPGESDHWRGSQSAIGAASRESIYPQVFSTQSNPQMRQVYLNDPAACKLVDFFVNKGLRAIKEEDQCQAFYDDWIEYQAKHRLYASVLSPKDYSALGLEFDLLKLTRFLEVFAYFSPAHGYSLQVTFLGLFSILAGTNPALKREATAVLEAGGLLAFGVSEKSHGADLLANEFSLRRIDGGRLVANGKKYYIGNANTASVISVLAGMRDGSFPSGGRRVPPALFVLRPRQSAGFGNVRKIPTLGIRSAFVGEFEVKEHELPAEDVVAEGRAAWDAVFTTVTLGKFFLGFGSIGICEHALEEAVVHLSGRVLFGKPVIDMPHIGWAVAQAYVRLTAMKLYAYRAVDYFHCASAADRRYLLFAAVQKAKVSTEGMKVLTLLSECLGARGFESDTYFEMALRDAQLIPGLEGSTHVNLGLASQFVPEYFARSKSRMASPKSLIVGEAAGGENPYLMTGRTGAINTITFAHFQDAYVPLRSIVNVRLFAQQARAFGLFVRGDTYNRLLRAETGVELLIGQCQATIAYAQLIAENSVRLNIPAQIISTVFYLLVNDLSVSALTLASYPRLDAASRILVRRLVKVPKAIGDDWDFVSARLSAPRSQAAAKPAPRQQD